MLRSVVPALAAALILPLLFIAAEAIVQGAPIVADDFSFAYTLVAPFALIVALAVAWPSYRLLPGHWPVGRRILAASVACFAVPVALFVPFADEFPWKAGVAGVATLLIWLLTRRLAGRLGPNVSIRSEPSG